MKCPACGHIQLPAILCESCRESWDEKQHPRGETTPASTPGSFAPSDSPERVMYEPTERQIAEWSKFQPPTIPSDDEFKAKAKRLRRPWGILKRDTVLSEMKYHPEYQRGIGQGRVDKARGLPYSEERSEKAYNLGYHRGYTEYVSNRGGWDEKTRQGFDTKYVNR